MHSFFGKFNILWRFIPNFAKQTHHIVDMMKGKSPFKWSLEGKNAFNKIKEAIAHAPVLVCPSYTKEFIMYSYASDHICLAILMHKNDEGIESPITFMSYPLKAHELKFSEMEKHTFVMVKALKHFRFYILNSHSISLVPNIVGNSILTQQEFGTKQGNWVAKIQEYDMEIKPTKLVHGKGLCQFIVDNKSNEEVVLENEGNSKGFPKVLFINATNEWYSDLSYLILTYGECLSHLSRNEKCT